MFIRKLIIVACVMCWGGAASGVLIDLPSGEKAHSFLLAAGVALLVVAKWTHTSASIGEIANFWYAQGVRDATKALGRESQFRESTIRRPTIRGRGFSGGPLVAVAALVTIAVIGGAKIAESAMLNPSAPRKEPLASVPSAPSAPTTTPSISAAESGHEPVATPPLRVSAPAPTESVKQVVVEAPGHEARSAPGAKPRPSAAESKPAPSTPPPAASVSASGPRAAEPRPAVKAPRGKKAGVPAREGRGGKEHPRAVRPGRGAEHRR